MSGRFVLAAFALAAAIGIGGAYAQRGGTSGGGGLVAAAFDGALTGNLDVSGTAKIGTADALAVAADGAISAADGTVNITGALTTSGGIAGTTIAASDTVTISGATTDITTGTNEDLTLVANGTGLIVLNDAVAMTSVRPTGAGTSIPIVATNGISYGTISVTTASADVAFSANDSNGFAVRMGTQEATIGKRTTATNTEAVMCASESITITSTSDTAMFCAYGGGHTATATRQSATCTDDGAGTNAALSLDPSSGVVYITNADANGCDVTVAETNAVPGSSVRIVVISSTGGTVNFADQASILNVSGAIALGAEDTLTLERVDTTDDLYVQTATSNN